MSNSSISNSDSQIRPDRATVAMQFFGEGEAAPRVGVRHVLVNLGGMLAVLALINAGMIWKLRHRPLLWHDYVAVMKQHMAVQHYAPPLEVLLLGDSTGNQAVQEKIYEHLDMPGRNLCTYANITLAGDAWMLDAYLRHNPPPRLVVLVHVFNILTRNEIEPGMLHRFPTREQSDFDPGFDLAARLDCAANRWFPLYFARSTVQQCVHNPRLLAKSFDACRWDASGCMYFEDHYDANIRKTARTNRRFLNLEPRVSDLNAAALRHMLEKARRHGFKIVYVQAPIYEALYRSEGFEAFQGQLLDSLQRVAEGYENVFTLDRRVDAVAFEGMGADSLHINATAAETFTRRLACRLLDMLQPDPTNATHASAINAQVVIPRR